MLLTDTVVYDDMKNARRKEVENVTLCCYVAICHRINMDVCLGIQLEGAGLKQGSIFTFCFVCFRWTKK